MQEANKTSFIDKHTTGKKTILQEENKAANCEYVPIYCGREIWTVFLLLSSVNKATWFMQQSRDGKFTGHLMFVTSHWTTRQSWFGLEKRENCLRLDCRGDKKSSDLWKYEICTWSRDETSTIRQKTRENIYNREENKKT